jgi:hypothetical protein
MINKTKHWDIYKIENPDGRIYIGCTSKFYFRKAYYKGAHCKGQKELYDSLLKYGYINHKFEIIESFEECIKYASEREIYWITYYKSCIKIWPSYNGLNLNMGISYRKRSPNQLAEYWKRHSQKVGIYSKKGELISIYRSKTEASLSLGRHIHYVSRILRLQNGHTKNYIFREEI